MVILGILAILQMAVIPGWIATSFWHHSSWLSRWLVSFALSLLINYVLVVGLVFLHLFNQPMVLGIVGLELIAVAVISFFKWRQKQTQPDFNFIIPLVSEKDLLGPLWWRGILTIGALLVFLSAVLSIIVQVASHNPGVFDLWDDFVSFNRWALIWYQGQIPLDNQFYPQLIPANWALGYHLIGRDDLQFFAKALMGLFPLAIVAVFADLWYRSRNLAWLLGGASATLWLTGLARSFLGSGYVDIPLAFVALLTYAVLISVPKTSISGWGPLILASVLAGTAALTKQGGLFVCGILLIGIVLLLWRQSWRRLFVGLGISIAVMSLVALPWYGYRWYQIEKGVSTSEVASVESALERSVGKSATFGTKIGLATRSVAAKIAGESLQAIHLLPTVVNKSGTTSTVSLSTSLVVFVSMIWLVLLVLGWFHPISRLVLLLIVLPFYLIWANWYSYDFRNLVLILPFFGLVAGFGLIQGIRLLMNSFGVKAAKHKPDQLENLLGPWSWHRGGAYLLLGTWAISLIVAGFWQWQYPLPKLQEMHLQKMSQVGTKSLNRQLYNYYRTTGLTGKIRTMYLPLDYLPELKDYALASPDTLTLDALRKYEKDPEVKYIFWWSQTMAPDTITYVQDQLKAKKYNLIFSQDNYQFFSIK